MADEYGADLVTVMDDEGNEHQFELLDAIETDGGRELIILEVNEEDGEEILVPIEDEDTFDEIAGLFEERLADLYEIEDLEPSELN